MGQDPFVAEITILACNFAPKGYAFCDGQLLPISQFTALFSLCGTFYGGDGKSTFALPDLQGCVPIHQGQSTTGTEYFLGQTGGEEFVTLLPSEMPLHTHAVRGHTADVADNDLPGPNLVLAKSNNGKAYQTNATSSLVTMAPQALALAGGSLPHNNMMPYLTLNFCLALQGVFPPR